MATKAKESTIVGKEKKAPSSNPHTTTTKRTPKPSTATTATNSTNKPKPKPNPTPSEKNIPNYLKPAVTSRLDSPSSKQPKSDSINNKPSPIRRRSLDKPISSSNLTKSAPPRRSSIGPITKSTIPSKPISGRTLKAPSDGKTKPLVTKSTKKTTPSTSTSTSTKKVLSNRDHASINSTKTTPKEATKTSNDENGQVKEVTCQEVEVMKVLNEKHNVEHVSDNSANVESEHEIEQVHGLEDSDQPHDHDERVISTVSEAEQEPQEEKAKDEEHELEEQNEINKDEGGNNNESGHQEKPHEDEVIVNGKKDEGEGGVIVIEDHNSENKNNEEVGKKEAVEKVEEAKVEATSSKQQLGERTHGHKKKKSLSNDVIEETAGKLLEARKNKVRALAGAFQTVIDHQTTSK